MEVTVRTREEYDALLDAIEVVMHERGLYNGDIMSDVFTPGIYSRTVTLPKNSWVLSYVHKQDHQFLMSTGRIIIYTEDEGMVFTQAPFLGITKAGTRRFAKTLTKVRWTSFHATDIFPKDDSEEAKTEARKLVEQEIYEQHENIFLTKEKETGLCRA